MSKGIPETRRDMLNAKYKFFGKSTCKSCGAAIEWWLTTNGKKMPFDMPIVGDEMDCEAITHWRTCPNSKEHKRERAEGPKGNLIEPQTPELLEREAMWFVQRHGARAVIVLCPGKLQAWAIRDGENAEDLRMDLITLVNTAKRWLDDEQKGATR